MYGITRSKSPLYSLFFHSSSWSCTFALSLSFFLAISLSLSLSLSLSMTVGFLLVLLKTFNAKRPSVCERSGLP